jgi:hypothetical protein
MTPDQQQRAIEKACEWDPLPEGYFHPDNPIGQTPPDYLNDLNAMHEAEKVLTYEQKEQFIFWMNHLHPSADIHYAEKKRELRLDVFDLVHTTAAQRAEAFLRTLGLWQPTPTQPQ